MLLNLKNKQQFWYICTSWLFPRSVFYAVMVRFVLVFLTFEMWFCSTTAQLLPQELHEKAFLYLLKGEKAQKRVWQDSFLLLAGKKIYYDTLKHLTNDYQKKFEAHQKKRLMSKFNHFFGKKPLWGVKIALDPGHFAGDSATARIEGKYIQMTLNDSTEVQFFESHLTWATAKLLQEKLEQAGAKVMLTRSQPHYTAFERTFRQEYQSYVEASEQQANFFRKAKKHKLLDEKQFFLKIFRKKELEERVRKINEFEPDLTLIIHYNVDENNAPWKKPVKQNFAMAFVGGAFEWQDLNEESTTDFLRLLLSQDLPLSIRLSERILWQHQKIAQISPIEIENSQKFLVEKCLFTGKKGVYARNLLLSRAVRGVLCYGESLLQDSEQEIKILNQKTMQVGNIWVSPRLQTIAEAYFQGILSYWKGEY